MLNNSKNIVFKLFPITGYAPVIIASTMSIIIRMIWTLLTLLNSALLYSMICLKHIPTFLYI